MAIRDNPVVKRALAFSEEQIGKIAGQLLANEAFVNTMQKVVGRSLELKAMVDKSVEAALSTLSIPTGGDLRRMGDRIDELEKAVRSLEERISSMDGPPSEKH